MDLFSTLLDRRFRLIRNTITPKAKIDCGSMNEILVTFDKEKIDCEEFCDYLLRRPYQTEPIVAFKLIILLHYFRLEQSAIKLESSSHLRFVLTQVVSYWAKSRNSIADSSDDYRAALLSFIVKYGQNVSEGSAANMDWDFCFTNCWHIKNSFVVNESWKTKVERRSTEVIVILKALLPYATSLLELSENFLTKAVNKYTMLYNAAAELLVAECSSLALSLTTLIIFCIILCYPLSLIDLVNEEQTMQNLEFFQLKPLWNSVSLSYRSVGGKLEDLQTRIASELVNLQDHYIRLIKRLEVLQKMVHPLQWEKLTAALLHPLKLHNISTLFDDLPSLAASISKTTHCLMNADKPALFCSGASKRFSKDAKSSKNAVMYTKSGCQHLPKIDEKRCSAGLRKKKKSSGKGNREGLSSAHVATIASQSPMPFRGYRECEYQRTQGNSSAFTLKTAIINSTQPTSSLAKQTLALHRSSSVNGNKGIAKIFSQHPRAASEMKDAFSQNMASGGGGWRRKGFTPVFSFSGNKGVDELDAAQRFHFFKIPIPNMVREKKNTEFLKAGVKTLRMEDTKQSYYRKAKDETNVHPPPIKNENWDNFSERILESRVQPKKMLPGVKAIPLDKCANSGIARTDDSITTTVYGEVGNKMSGVKFCRKKKNSDRSVNEKKEQEEFPVGVCELMPSPTSPADILCPEPSSYGQPPMMAYWHSGTATTIAAAPASALQKDQSGMEAQIFPRGPSATMAIPMAAVPFFRGNPLFAPALHPPPFYIMKPCAPPGGLEKEEGGYNETPVPFIGSWSFMDRNRPFGNAGANVGTLPAAPVIQGTPYAKGLMPVQGSLPPVPFMNPGVIQPMQLRKSHAIPQANKGGKVTAFAANEGPTMESAIRLHGANEVSSEASMIEPRGASGMPPKSPITKAVSPISFQKVQRNSANRLLASGVNETKLPPMLTAQSNEKTTGSLNGQLHGKETENNDNATLDATRSPQLSATLHPAMSSRPVPFPLTPLYEEMSTEVVEIDEENEETSTAASSLMPVKFIKDFSGVSTTETRQQSKTSEDSRSCVIYSQALNAGINEEMANDVAGNAANGFEAEQRSPSKKSGFLAPPTIDNTPSPPPIPLLFPGSRRTREETSSTTKLPSSNSTSSSPRVLSPSVTARQHSPNEKNDDTRNNFSAKKPSLNVASPDLPYAGATGGVRARTPTLTPVFVPPASGASGNAQSGAGDSSGPQVSLAKRAGGGVRLSSPPVVPQPAVPQLANPPFKNLHKPPSKANLLVGGVGNVPVPPILEKAPLVHKASPLKQTSAELGLGVNNALLASLEIEPAKVKINVEVGVGATSVVFKGLWRGTDVALKRLKVNVSEDNTREFLKELAIMTRLRHPNLVLLMGIISRSAPYYVVTEFCAGGTLFDILHKYRVNLTWSQRIKIAGDIAKGCTYLHASQPQILHRDLKSLNILLAEPITGANDVPLAKVSDFGMSKIRQQADIMNMTGMAGTFQWMAPEVLHNQPYDEKVDIYSYGIVLYELITSRVPYEECQHSSAVATAIAVAQGLRPDLRRIPNECPRSLRSLMVACWDSRPQKRPMFSQIVDILKHPNLYGKI